MTRLSLFAALAAVSVLSAAGIAQQPAAPRAKVRAIQHVRDNLYWIPGSDRNTYNIPGSGYDASARTQTTGGNTAVLVTEGGVVLVDTMNPGSGAEILAQVKTVTSKPISMILNTHTHFDHAGSNTEFPATVEFVAHENTRNNMAKPECPPVTHCQAFKGENAKYLPKRTYKDRLTLLSGKDRIDLYYFGPGHTNGDSFIVFPAVRAMHTGDMFQRRNMPFIDVANNGGSAVAFSKTLNGAATTITGVDTIIAGHSPTLLSWNDFKEYTEYYAEFLASVQGSMKAGRNAEAAIAAYKPADRFKHFETDAERVKQNVAAVFAGSGRAQ
jgi:glyoxylase-like metal-dependent hydrolase (beta-lactamase superfamily II)